MPPNSAEADAPALDEGGRRARVEPGLFEQGLHAMASLKLTVVLFALTILLVFVGTLAQVDHDIWYVVEEGYFRVWFAKFEWQAFVRLAEMFSKEEPQPITGGFWFPGGLLLGSVMFLNLLAAHAIRFKVAAKGGRLTAGLAVLAAGVAATVAVIVEGMDESLKGQLSPAFCDGLWQALRAALAGAALLGVYWSVQRRGTLRAAEWWLATAFNAQLLALAAYLYANPSLSPDDAGMRIVWELTKCGGVAVLAFAGCWLVFKQRAGIVLLHAGIGLLMIGELVTHLSAVEGQMRIPEGATVNYVDDIRSTELAITTDEGEATRVTVVPDRQLIAAALSGETISHPDLPFDLRVKRFDKNSRLAAATPDTENLATAGGGLSQVAVSGKSVSGVSMGAGVNMPSSYIEPLDKKSGESLGTWLVSNSYQPTPGGGGISLRPQAVQAGDQTHEIELRFERTYKDYSITLEDFRFDKYVGTQTPKNYSSDVILSDPSRGVERPVRIWMNNPLRYAGDTLYQSGFNQTERGEATILQVVTNGGWMIPYVSCVLVGLGMLSHFTITLARFARRRVDEEKRLAKKSGKEETVGPGVLSAQFWSSPTVLGPAIAGLLVAGYFAGKAKTPADEPGQLAVQRFGSLPVAEGGRVKPIDTLARQTLQAISALQEVKEDADDRDGLPAIEWLLDTVSGRKGWDKHRVFRIENLELLDALGLKPRKGFYRYSYAELMAKPSRTKSILKTAWDAVATESSEGESLPKPTIVQRKTVELARKVLRFQDLIDSFSSPQIGGEGNDIVTQVQKARGVAMRLQRSGAVRAVPPATPAGEWTTLFETELMNMISLATQRPINEVGADWSDALATYAQNDAKRFADKLTDIEAGIEKYQRSLEEEPEVLAGLARSERLDAGKVRFEHFFTAFSPFYYCAAMYLVAFVLTCFGWLGGGSSWPRTLGRCATAVIVVTLLVHTFALVGRVYISGRPPVTNLYSSAVFIGWAAVLFGVAFEAIYRLGIGNAVASAVGLATLIVAHYLSLDGDTFTVLQAVLDTQFWLATHVVCVTLGYATVYFAGGVGIVYLLAGLYSQLSGSGPIKSKPVGRMMTGMIYGMLCFALLFSFIGTVLGGLWADDSWGRFWGWDPKENGALIIVLWNALVLHARWGKMVGPVGLAMLAVGGNIVTTWSWFGVNELGVGLHSYGANESDTALYMLYFAISQLLIIALGIVVAWPSNGVKRAAA